MCLNNSHFNIIQLLVQSTKQMVVNAKIEVNTENAVKMFAVSGELK